MIHRIKEKLETNYNSILSEYKKFNFDNKNGITSEENRDIFYESWKREYKLSFKRVNEEEPKNIKTIKKFDYWYAYENDNILSWESVLLAYRWNNILHSTHYGKTFFSHTLKNFENESQIDKIALARLLPDGKVPQHKGSSKFHRMHLGLIVPDGDVKLKVNDLTMSWVEGKCLSFNDCDAHMAWNNTEYDRIVLILDTDREYI